MSTKAGQFIKSYEIMLRYIKQYKNCFFLLYKQHSLTFMVGLFSKKSLQLKVVDYFCKKAAP